MRPTLKCTGCGFIVHNDDPDYDRIKKRHMDKYKPHKTRSERDGHSIAINNVKTKPVWVTVWT